MASMMGYNPGSGAGGFLKEGSRHFSNANGGSDSQYSSVTIRNLEACIQLCKMLSSSYGPHGRCKLCINHLGKINVTSDCAAILKEIDIEHPAAQLLARAVEKQEQTCGDNTNYVLSLAGEICYQTIELIRKMGGTGAVGSAGSSGLNGGNNNNNVLNDILAGYAIANEKIQKELLALNCIANDIDYDIEGEEDVEKTFVRILKPVLMTKQYGSQDVLAPIVAKACLITMKSTNSAQLNPGSIRTVKILGSSIESSELIQGYVAQRGLEVPIVTKDEKTGADVHSNVVNNCNIAIYACGIEASATEAKGTVLMKNASDLKSYNISEEKKMEDIILGIKNSNIQLIVSGGNVSDMALHYLSKYNIGCLRIGSKWELRRLCQATNATPLVRLGAPTKEEIGFASKVIFNKIIGSKKVTIFSQEKDDDEESKSELSTIILRATTSSVLNDLERAVEDGVRTIEMFTKSMSKNKSTFSKVNTNKQLIYGGGAIEMSMAIALHSLADTHPGLEQYSIRAFAKSLEVIPRILATNAGLEPYKVIANLQAVHYNHYHNENNSNNNNSVCDIGVDIDINDTIAKDTNNNNAEGITSMKKKQIVDLLMTKKSAIRLAVDATMTILKIDQIIMSKQAGGGAAAGGGPM